MTVAGPTIQESARDGNQPRQDQKTSTEGFRVSVDVELVTTDVAILGAPESELQAEDFIIYDNSVTQQISFFSRDQLPLAVAILVDSSGSITDKLPALQNAAITALERLKPEDQVALYSFDWGYHRLINLTEDRFLIAERIGKLRTVAGGTDIYDTVYDAARYLKENAPHRRRAIILISDNCHYFGDHTADDCRNELLETATTLYNVVTPSSETEESPFCKESNPMIQHLAEETGGEVLNLQGSTSIKAALEKIMFRLRMQYTLGFSPSNPGPQGSFHELSVSFANEKVCPGCRLLARRGYYTGVTTLMPPHYYSPGMDHLLVQRRVLIAASTDLDLDEIRFTHSTVEQTNPNGQPQLRIDMHIDPTAIDFSILKDRHYYKVMVAIFYTDKEPKVLGSQWRIIEGDLSKEDYSWLMKMGSIKFSTTVPSEPKKQFLKIVVYDEKSDRVGSRYIQLRNNVKQEPSH